MASQSSKYKVWDSCRAEARRIDGEIEIKLAALEQLAHGPTDSAAMARVERDAKDIGAALDRLANVVGSLAEMSAQLREEGDAEAANVARHTARFDEVLLDKRVALQRLAQDARRRHERGQLLNRVHSEIAEFDGRADLRTASAETEAIRRSLHGVESVLATQARAGEKLTAQRQMFNQIGDKALQVADQIPYVRDLLKRIDAKRRREAVMLAVLIGVLMFIAFLFW